MLNRYSNALTLKGHPPTNTRLGISTPYGSIPDTGTLAADAALAEGGGGGGGGPPRPREAGGGAVA